jgi:hypothetical protein
MDVFIVRPFGVKKVLKENKDAAPSAVEIDFEKIQRELIDPALQLLKLDGGTTGKIFEAGDIREDMFSLLLQADLVIADITIHNANAFYELGVRHALRDRKTVLIKSPGLSETPFDILGYRYLPYDRDAPGKALPELVQMITETRNAARVDSPVFNVLPKLKAQDYEKFIAVPAGFAEEVRNAREAGQLGKLSLLAYEAEDFNWAVPGLRLIGEALYQSRAFDLARLVWEKVKGELPLDLNANDRLATIYQRLAERELTQNPAVGAELLGRSDSAIDILLANPLAADKDKRAEFFALKGRNKKTRWLNAWKNLSAEEKGPAALLSDWLGEARALYEAGYYHNLNHYYAGVNALSLLTIELALAEKHPAEWENKFGKKRDAERALEDLHDKRQQLTAAMRVTIDAEQQLLRDKNQEDTWLDITEADFIFLTEPAVGRVTTAYKTALQGATAFNYDAVQRQLMLFKSLGIFAGNVDAVLQTMPAQHAMQSTVTHILLFTGHMIDKPGRETPRFPASHEQTARREIKKLVMQETADQNKTCLGISGGACGGDILFHEVCRELGIKTELYLALPRDEFISNSVAFAGPSWIDRFNALYSTMPHYTLCDTPSLPKWLEKKKDYTIWTRNNLWELHNALVNGGMHLSVIALWDGKGGDGPGGTEHMVKEAQSKGAKTLIIDSNTLTP